MTMGVALLHIGFNGFNVKEGINYIAVAIDVAAEKLAGYRF